jgi:hypothetical protein
MKNVGIFYCHFEDLRPFRIFYDHNVVIILYIFQHFGKLCQEKSGNPVPTHGSRFYWF